MTSLPLTIIILLVMASICFLYFGILNDIKDHERKLNLLVVAVYKHQKWVEEQEKGADDDGK